MLANKHFTYLPCAYFKMGNVLRDTSAYEKTKISHHNTFQEENVRRFSNLH